MRPTAQSVAPRTTKARVALHSLSKNLSDESDCPAACRNAFSKGDDWPSPIECHATWSFHVWRRPNAHARRRGHRSQSRQELTQSFNVSSPG
eukprot:scaffold453_cov243-Pinguiococcus_pyrenoidosus.AAC.15